MDDASTNVTVSFVALAQTAIPILVGASVKISSLETLTTFACHLSASQLVALNVVSMPIANMEL